MFFHSPGRKSAQNTGGAFSSQMNLPKFSQTNLCRVALNLTCRILKNPRNPGNGNHIYETKPWAYTFRKEDFGSKRPINNRVLSLSVLGGAVAIHFLIPLPSSREMMGLTANNTNRNSTYNFTSESPT